MVTKEELLALVSLSGFVLAAFSKKLPTVNTTPKTIRPLETLDFSKPLPFKTIEQQRSEFVPEYETITKALRGNFNPSDISFTRAVQGLESEGFTVNLEPRTRRGIKTGSFGIFGTKQVQTNVFKPQLTSL